MKAILLLCWVSLAMLPNHLTPDPDLASQDSITVYVFLHESCLISQYYTLPLREMHEQYASENLQFVGLFPNLSSKPAQIKAFQETYQIPFQLKPDYFHQKMEAFGAAVTPEVVVYNETKQQILYKGRIDDAYARVGQKKRIVSSSELKDALEAIQHDQPIKVSETTAVGCFISPNKL
ncbi:MAG: hypothetical protein AAFQ87_05125 [Bacteroidota bacterium]